MTICALLLVLAAFMRLGPDIPFKSMLNRHLAEKPVAAALRFRRHHIFYACLALGMFLFGGEMVLVLGPEFLLAYAADAALYFDIVAASAIASSLSRARGVVRHWQRRLAFVLERARLPGRRARAARRARRTPSATGPANDDDGGHGRGDLREDRVLRLAA